MHKFESTEFRMEAGLSILVRNALNTQLKVQQIATACGDEHENVAPRVVVATNEEKYASTNLPYGTSADLSEVFELMRSLNYEGITNPKVGCFGGGTVNFAEILDQTCHVIAKRYANQPLRYVELGPEPIKTELFISGLLARGVNLDTYISVDINPASAGPMRDVIKRVNSNIKTDHILCNFNELTRDNLIGDQPALFTSLGFQEGNHFPDDVQEMLGRVLNDKDCYLSEMQVWDEKSEPAILNFYELRQMQDFSKNCLRRAYGNIESTYDILLLEVPINPGHIKVAITTETFWDDSGNCTCYVTNYCLKPTVEQLSSIREADQKMRVFQNLTTSDRSMLLQLTERKG